MKKFFLNVLSSTAGVFLAFAIMFFLTLFFVISAAVGSQSAGKPQITSHSVLRLELNGVMAERTQDSPLASIGLEKYAPSLEEMIQAVDVAAKNKNIDGIYIKTSGLISSPASLQELRRALNDFRKTGKFVVTYGDTYTQGAYYLCSAGSSVILNPIGQLEWRGLGGEMMFYKDLLAKIGVEMQVVKVGTYKSAVEPFTSTEMSPANREQVNRYITSIWDNMKKEVSASRKISVSQLDGLADSYMALKSGKDVLASKLVDRLAYEDEALRQVAKLTHNDDADDVNYVSASQLAPLAAENVEGDEVAVYYASGDIVSSEEQGGFFDEAIVADKVIPDLKDLSEDDDVKAVVLRINSGGGSAYASEQIWHAVKKLAAKKPVVVSMGDMAASGAYYMSAGAQYIVAEPTTLTGSIGIFGMIPDVSALMTDKLGIKFDGVKTNKHADFFSQSRPLNADERAMMQSYVDRGYDLFTTRVAQGRKMTKEQVWKIAEGRVWTGEDALKIHLVDRLGNLGDAVAVAAKRAGLKEYHQVHYPAAKKWWEEIFESKAEEYTQAQLKNWLGQFYPAFSLLKSVEHTDRVQALMPFTPVIK